MSIKKEMRNCFDEICKLSGIENSVVRLAREVSQMYKLIDQLPDPPMTKSEAKEAAFEHAKQFENVKIIEVDSCYKVLVCKTEFPANWEEKEVFPFVF